MSRMADMSGLVVCHSSSNAFGPESDDVRELDVDPELDDVLEVDELEVVPEWEDRLADRGIVVMKGCLFVV